MCRHAAYCGPPLAPSVLVFGGSHSLVHQSHRPREMLSGTVNADGYAVAWYHEGRPIRASDTRPIWQSPDLEDLLGSVRSRVITASVRNATPGIPVDRSGVAPIRHEGWTFALNGYLSDYRRVLMRQVHERIAPDLYPLLTGVSDTEALFLLALARLREGGTPGDAVEEVVSSALALAGEAGIEAQLNLLLTTPEGAVASRASSTGRSNSLYLARTPSLAPGGTLLASEPFDDDAAWELVPEGSLVTLRADGPATVRPLPVRDGFGG